MLSHYARAGLVASMLCMVGADEGIELVELHGPAGQRYFVNPQQITTVRQPIATDRQYFGTGTRCIIVMTNGKFVAVADACDQVRQLVERSK